MQRIEESNTSDDQERGEQKRRRNSRRVRSFLLNFFTFGPAILVIVASYIGSGRDDGPSVDENAGEELALESHSDLW